MYNPFLVFIILLFFMTSCTVSKNKLAKLGDKYRTLAELPGELTADQILNGEYLWPPSPEVKMEFTNSPHFKTGAFGKVPAPGVHPRILFSPEDLPSIRERIKKTETGRLATKTLEGYQNNSIRKKGTASYNVYEALAASDFEKSKTLLADYKNAGDTDNVSWYHRPNFPYILMLETLDALLKNDTARGKKLATAITTLGAIYQSNLDLMDNAFANKAILADAAGTDGNAQKANSQLNSDVWRSGRRDAIGGEPWFAYMYDFAFNFMDENQQRKNRKVLTTYIYGKTSLGSHMPHHFRRWNWVAVGSGLLLTAAAVEGEEGDDPRVMKHQFELMTDYLKYGWSEAGSSREAIGYTQFGLRWGSAAYVAMARRGTDFWNLKRWYNSVSWYAHAVQPGGGRFMSHGDGGDGGPNYETMLVWKQAWPTDPLTDYVMYQSLVAQNKGSSKLEGGRGFLEYMLLFAADPTPDSAKNIPDLPLTFFDPERNSLIAHSGFGKEEVQFQIESRGDTTAPSHDHADRGSFTFAGAGRSWAIDRFRGIESRHHNVVTINGMGQGYFPLPGKWVALVGNESAVFAVTDTKEAYSYYWQGTVSGFSSKSEPRRFYDRWKNFAVDTDKWISNNPGFNWRANLDRSPVVEKFYNGYEKGDPRMWDEYARPVRVPFNTVKKAVRTAGLVRGAQPYAIIIDDIQKDNKFHNYEWNMMVDDDVELDKIATDEIILKERGGKGRLYIKVLNRAIPKQFENNPQIRLESIEYKDARDWPEGRSFGIVKRLVIPSYAVAPKFKILLYAYYEGAELPVIAQVVDTNKKNHETQSKVSEYTIEWKTQKDVLTTEESREDGTRLKIVRDNSTLIDI